jgi:hypothetical protein
MKSNFTLLIVLGLLLFSSSISAQWELVYENDAAGQRLAGSKANLIAAVRSGKEIRVGWVLQRKDNRLRKVEHVAAAKFLTVMSDKHVFAQIDPIVGQTPIYADSIIRLKENLEWSFIASTTGEQESMMRQVVTGEIVGHRIGRNGIKWWVLNRQ